MKYDVHLSDLSILYSWYLLIRNAWHSSESSPPCQAFNGGAQHFCSSHWDKKPEENDDTSCDCYEVCDWTWPPDLSTTIEIYSQQIPGRMQMLTGIGWNRMEHSRSRTDRTEVVTEIPWLFPPSRSTSHTPCCRRTEAIREAVRCLRAMVQLRGSNDWRLGRKHSTGWINVGSPFPQTSTNMHKLPIRSIHIYTMWIQNSTHLGQVSTCFLLCQHND